jgi:CRISPR-associated endonuclease/helicase Cas3
MAAPHDYAAWFEQTTGLAPHAWQRRLGQDADCKHRLIRVPTGLGKTAGATLAWLFHRAVRNDPGWPRRLIYTLPQRALVEPTESSIQRWLARAELDDRVNLHVLSAAVRARPWALMPDALAILIGTHDMVLSRALNRGHGTPRALWPAELGVLHHDALWVLDEVQLMDVGLMTSAQLAAFRQHDAHRVPWFRPAQCWWMSATLDPERLRSVDSAALIEPLSRRMTGIPGHERRGGPWETRKRAERRAEIKEPDQMAALALQRHVPGTLTLCVVNRVEHSIAVFRELHRQTHARTSQGGPELRLVHSRFRGVERRAWFEEFLDRRVDMQAAGRIVVCTQVVEASVDVSARLVITELSPWSSLVQRAGRAARYEGREAEVIVIGPVPDSDQGAAPYDARSLAAADDVWRRLMKGWDDASMRSILEMEERLRDRAPELYATLHGPEPGHMLQRSDLDALFETAADVSGADIDVSCFVHGEHSDVWVAWRDLDAQDVAPDRLDRPDRLDWPDRLDREVIGAITRDELCAVPVNEARAWLQQMEHGYVLDYVEGAWVRMEASRLVPGAVVVVPAHQGGYDRTLGWDPGAVMNARRAAAPVNGNADLSAKLAAKLAAKLTARMAARVTAEAQPQAPAQGSRAAENLALTRFWDAAAAHDDDSSSIGRFQTIAGHGGETARAVAALCGALGIGAPHRDELALAARWHDAGKAHKAFQDAIAADARAAAGPDVIAAVLARAPAHAWLGQKGRPGFRHELAGALALFELLYRAAPEHPAMLGAADRALVARAGMEPARLAQDEDVAGDDPLAGELVALSADAFDRVAYLVCSHHGKVRCSWDSSPADERAGYEERAGARIHGRIHGIGDGDELSGLVIEDRTGTPRPVAALTLHLDAAAMGLGARYGASWVERVARLRARLGPFALAFLEAVLRAADVRTSLRHDEDALS